MHKLVNLVFIKIIITKTNSGIFEFQQTSVSDTDMS